LSYSKILNTIGIAPDHADLDQRGMIDKLLLEEEAKLKKYDDDRKKK